MCGAMRLTVNFSAAGRCTPICLLSLTIGMAATRGRCLESAVEGRTRRQYCPLALQKAAQNRFWSLVSAPDTAETPYETSGTFSALDPMMQIIGTFAEFDRARLRERTRSGLDSAREQGRVGGRRPKLNQQQQQEVVRLVNSGKKTAGDAARLFKGFE